MTSSAGGNGDDVDCDNDDEDGTARFLSWSIFLLFTNWRESKFEFKLDFHRHAHEY